MKAEKKQGVPIARIAQKYGVSRQTVYNVLAEDSTAPKERKQRASILDPFKDFIRAKLENFDLPATTVLEDVQKLGYRGGLTVVKEFVRGVKGEQVRQVIERFETVPGQQAQIDWGECGTITVDGVRRKLYVFVLVLGFSRVMFARFTTSTRQPVLLTVLKEALSRLGVPRELLVDNMKTAVERHAPDGEVRFNRGFLDFCEHYGVAPIACPPYWPRAKGKVECGVKFVKGSFLTGRSFATLADLNEQLEAWLDSRANLRVHGTTGERPIDRFAREVEFLRPAAAVPAFDTRELLLRTVHADSHVRLNRVAYSVPPKLGGKSIIDETVHVRIVGNSPGMPFEILLGGEVLASHVVAPAGTWRVTLPEHENEIRRAAAAARRPRKPKPMFEQHQPPEPPYAGSSGVELAPLVQARSLSEYERLLEAS